MRALLIEDDQTIADFVVRGLKEAGFVVDRAAEGVEGLSLARDGRYDVAIVDLMLPGLDGMTIIQALRRDGIRTPVLILSARQAVNDRVSGLEIGGDDYLTKPFAFPELLARVQALIRRAGPAGAAATADATTLTVGDLSLDLLTRQATRAGRALDPLRPREFALLEYLLRNAGRVVSKTMILSHVWDYSFDPRTNVVDVLVFRLREKVDKGFPTRLIHTVRGMGYVLKVE
jgi:two-component system OmpR family response regulator